MSQRRRRIRRTATPIGPTRRERTIAYLGAAGVVAFTAVTVWALRPGGPQAGNPGQPLTGGIANRQPKATWLLVLTVAALIGAVVWAVRRRADGGGSQRTWLVGASLIVLIVASTAGFLWPGGLVFHFDPPPTLDLPTPTSATPTSATPVGPTSVPTDSSTPTDPSTPSDSSAAPTTGATGAG